MTKIIDSDVRSMNETFIGIIMSIPLVYIAYYHLDK